MEASELTLMAYQVWTHAHSYHTDTHTYMHTYAHTHTHTHTQAHTLSHCTSPRLHNEVSRGPVTRRCMQG